MSQVNDFNHENHLDNPIKGLNNMKSSMTQSDTQSDDYNPCEIPSRILRHGTGCGLKKI